MWEQVKNWMETRIGLDDLVRSQVTEYRVPKNINIFYTLGFVAAAGYLIQVLSGILLLIYYVPHPDHAFKSVQLIMHKVPYGWLFRQMHVVGSNLMIAAIGLHMLTVFAMGNYKRPRELTWVGGALLLFVTIAFGFSGYLLPWTQLSYWATTVVTSIPTAVPVVGDFVAGILRGGDQVTGATLSRFFSFHVSILPPLFMILVGVHLFLIRRIGISATPFGRQAEEKRPWTEYHKKSQIDGYPYYPRFFQMDMLMVMVYLAVMFAMITFTPNLFFSEEATIPANALKTPVNIRPEWYLLAPYQMLKIIPNKFLGIIIQLALFLVFLLWPFFDTEKEKNIMKRPVLRGLFLFSFILWIILMFWGRS
jgi:ubiquinol-cytochrome c reductase cytochrome b subunit